MVKGEAHSLDSPVTFRERFRLIERVWGSQLDASSKAVLWMILDRTLGWGKAQERIPMRQFTDGVHTGKGVVIHPGTGLSRATVIRKIAELLDVGILIRRDQCDYEINFDWSPELVATLRTPKRLQAQDPSRGYQKDTRGSQKETKRVSKRYPIREEKEEGTKLEEKAAPKRRSPPSKKLADSVRSIESASTRKLLARVEKARSSVGVPNATAVGTLWNDYAATAYPDHAPTALTRKLMAMLRGYAFRYCRMGGPKEGRVLFEKFSEYAEWVTLEWALIMDNRFEWADNTPPYPEVRFFVGMASHFERAWEERKQVEALRDMTPREAFKARLLAKGKSEEAAERAVEERFHVRDESERLVRAQQAHRQEREALAADRDRNAQATNRKAATGALRARTEALRAQSQPTGEHEWRD